MTTQEIETYVKQLFEDFSEEDFIFDLLLAYGISKTSITRLRKGDFNLAQNPGEILYKKKVFFKEEKADNMLHAIEQIAGDNAVLRHQPRFVIVTDFKTLVAKDLKLGKNLDIPLKDLPQYFGFFLPLAGSEVYHSANDNEADREAAYQMAQLYDNLVTENSNIYHAKGNVHELNIFLSRLLFCYFAEDTEIFAEESIFTDNLAQHTADNGSDVHLFLDRLFGRLNTKDTDPAVSEMPHYLTKFPYVNGGLFRDKIDSPVFKSKARKILLELGGLNWKDINPDIFGSMIQAVVIPEYRSDLGMHYTSVPNILKLIKPLFLDELYGEYEKHQNSIPLLRKLIHRMSKIKFFDPACGSGNFLIITYKEIRVLEIKILQRIIELSPDPILEFTQIGLSQFYGIEIDDFACEMAVLSLWLAEHQMNRVFEDRLLEYGKSKPILPLKQAGKIVQANAARVNWAEVCPVIRTAGETLEPEVYVIGNPPYLGARMQDASQKADMDFVFHGIKGFNNMDYISCWFYKAKHYIEGFKAKVAFVSTNSICQGEQVALLWPHLISDKIEIGFAYQSFKWTNNAKGNAGVTVIILSLRNISNEPKYIFEGNIRKEAKNINPYLMDSANVVVTGRSSPLSNFPEISFGNMANDGGNLLMSAKEKNELLAKEPEAIKYIKRLVGALEFIRGVDKYCLWIEEDSLDDALQITSITDRLSNVKKHRINSSRKATQVLASKYYSFGEVRHQESDSILVPRHSSENREYIPLGFYNGDTVIADSAMAIYDAQPWLFGLLHSKMHMAWVRAVGGKLEERLRYSAKLCYNTFPFPDISVKQKENLNLYVFAILDARANHPGKTMAYLYNPDTMPADLKQAHQDLDRAIEQCYRLQPFTSDSERLEYLFKLYGEMVKQDKVFAKQKNTMKKKKQ